MNKDRIDALSALNGNSSVYCNCFNESTNVNLHGTFWKSSGKCPRCGVIFVATQTPIDDQNTRYEVERIETIKSEIGKLITLLS